tara:strand:+ start:158 stop:793 length:636 start_codon:yes stop_codon:yes gene_type:complete
MTEGQNPRNLMPKNVAQIFPTYIIGYENPDKEIDNQSVIKFLETQEFTPGPHQPYQTIDNHLENSLEIKKLYDWFNACLEDYRKTFNYACDGYKIILSWANKANSSGSHRMHVHPNSFISGIYYLSDSPSPTYFEDPRYQLRSGWFVATDHPIQDSVWTCPSDTGSLVLFPSWLPHFTEGQPFDGWRYSISFNVIPVGVTNSGSLTEMNLV